MLYDKYSTPEFCEIAQSLTNSLFVQHKTQSEIVQMPSAQMEFAPLPYILTITTFSNHLEILNRTHSYQEAVFYMLYAAQQQLTTNELRRTIVTPTSVNSLLCRWRKLGRIDKTADAHWRRLH